MVFQRASFVCSCLGTDVRARDQILDAQVDILARGPFWVNVGVPKKYSYDKMTSWWKFRGIPVTQMDSVVPRTHLGKLLCPNPLFFKGFQAN